MVLARRRLPDFYQQVAGGGVATLLAVAAAATPLDVDPSLVVTANIIMLLAGIGFMGALQDALTGFYLTAGARLIEAMLATAGIIAGVSAGLTVADVLGSSSAELDPGGAASRSVPVVAHRCRGRAPRRLRVLVVRARAGARADRAHRRCRDADLAVGRRCLGFGRTWPAALAAFFIGLVATPSPAGCGCRRWSWWSPPSCRCCPASRSTAACRCSPRAAATSPRASSR